MVTNACSMYAPEVTGLRLNACMQLETAERRQAALQQELATSKNDMQLLKMEADMAVARERQAVAQFQAENLTLQQQVTALNQQALDHAQLTRAHQLLQAQFEALLAENAKLEARIVRIKKKKDEPVAPWPAADIATTFNVDDLLNEAAT